MAPTRSDGARNTGELHRAQQELRDIADIATRVHALVASYRGSIAPLPQRIQQLIGGSATGTDKQVASDFDRAQKSLGSAEHALQEATQRALRASGEAGEAQRRSSRER